MKKSPIHFSKEERLATQSTGSTVSAIQKNTQAVTDAVKSIPKQDNSDIVRKLDEVKSASLVTNQKLDKIAKKPDVQKVQIEGISLVTIKGDPGKNAKPPTDGELLALIRPLIPKPVKGEKGNSPTAEELLVLIRPLIPAKAKDGHTPTETELLAIIQPLIPAPLEGAKGDPGINAPVLSPDETVGKINSAKILIDAERVRGLVNAIREIEKIGTNPSGAAGGGATLRYLDDGTLISAHVTELNFGTNLTATYDSNGRVTINATAGSGSFTELPATGAVNSSNVTYTFTSVPTYIVTDGVWLKATDSNGGVNWSNAGLTITMVNPPSLSIYGF